jgi:HSP20 family protein
MTKCHAIGESLPFFHQYFERNKFCTIQTVLIFQKHINKLTMITFKNNSNPRFFDPFSFASNQRNLNFTKQVAPSPRVYSNILKTELGHVIELAVPGFQKQDFKINVDKNKLIISFEQEHKKSEKKYIKKEFSTASFSKTFTLSTESDLKRISASYDLGILTVKVPLKDHVITKIEIN